MATPEPWPAASHGPLTEVAAGLWIVDGELPDLPIGRRMVLWRTADGGLATHSAIACAPETMAAIDALGPVRWIVVPSGFHRMDAPRWKARYPEAQVVAMPGSHRRVAARVAVDGDYQLLPAGGSVEWVPLAGVPAEAVFIHHGDDDRETLVFNDAFMNLPDRLPGAKGWVMKLIGSTGGPKVTWTARMFIVKDRRAYADHLRQLAARPRLARIIPAHGAVITDGAAAALAGAADRLYRR